MSGHLEKIKSVADTIRDMVDIATHSIPYDDSWSRAKRDEAYRNLIDALSSLIPEQK